MGRGYTVGMVFITGGSGYVGRNLIRALVGRDSVRALARSEKAMAAVAALGAAPVRGDLDFLICSDSLCVPQKATIDLSLNVG